jgi:hypothetical protein
MGTFTDMPDGNSAALSSYQSDVDRADELADQAEAFRDEAADEITAEICKDADRLSDTLCESEAVNDGNALDALAILYCVVAKLDQDALDRTQREAMELVRSYVRERMKYSDDVECRMYELAGQA